MAIKAVVFDIGGVLEITPKLGVDEKWEKQLQLAAGELNQRLMDVWHKGAIGQITEAEVHERIGALLGIDAALVNAFMADIWQEYLGTLNIELYTYFGSLHRRYQTAIISNSFVGAREKEETRYQFAAVTDLIIYSHEVGISKPDPRIFHIACECLGIEPHEMMFLDDVPLIIEAAQALGIHGVVFHDTAQAITEIKACLQTFVE